MPRFFVTPDQVDNDKITITGGDVNHIRNVLRMSCGEELSVSDGSGKDYVCVISFVDKDFVELRIENTWDSFAELKTKLYLFQGLPKADKMELIIQKAVELGVYEIIPVVTSRTVVKLDDKKEGKKLSRWQQISESAAKQSGRALIPAIKAPMTYKAALDYAKSLDASIIPYERAKGMDEARALIRSMHDKKSIGIFIGPEGGFEEREISAASDAGVIPMTLGNRILRTETAGLTVLALLMFELDQ